MTVSVRLMNCLKEIDGAINPNKSLNIEKLRNMEDGEFLRIPNFGRKSLNELREIIKLEGLHPNLDGFIYIKLSDLGGLHERNVEIYNMRKTGLTLRAVAEKYNVTKERVRQIVCKIDRIQTHPRYRLEGVAL